MRVTMTHLPGWFRRFIGRRTGATPPGMTQSSIMFEWDRNLPWLALRCTLQVSPSHEPPTEFTLVDFQLRTPRYYLGPYFSSIEAGMSGWHDEMRRRPATMPRSTVTPPKTKGFR